MRRSSGVIIPALLIFAAHACLGASATNGMNEQSHDKPQEQHVIASPNPTIDDGKTDAGAQPTKVEAVKVLPAHGSTAAPMKTTESKPKPNRRRTKPQTD